MTDKATEILVSDARFNTPSPNPTHLSMAAKNSRIARTDATGYVTPVFKGKEHQMEKGIFIFYSSCL